MPVFRRKCSCGWVAVATTEDGVKEAMREHCSVPREDSHKCTLDLRAISQ